MDIPDTVLGQLGNRVQHALRAFTPRDQKAVKVAATTMRPNPKLDLEQAIGELGVGEALISCLDAKGTPVVTERAWVLPPGSRIGPATPDECKALIANSLVAGTYEKTVDRESAYEKLRGSVATAGNGQTQAQKPGTAEPQGEAGGSSWAGDIFGTLTKGTGKTGRGDSILESMAKSAGRTLASQVGRELVRGVLGSLLGGGGRKK